MTNPSSKQKVLIIARDFIPYYHSLGGVIRMVKLAESFQQNNIDVFILSAKGEEISYFGYKNLIKSFNVTYVRDYLQIVTNRARKIDNNQSNLPRTTFRNRIFSLLSIIEKEFSIPDRGRYFTKKFVTTALKTVKKNNIRNIIISSPPHSTQMIGLRLKRLLGDKVNLIVDYRDSWNTIGIFKKRNPLSRYFSENLERKVLDACDHFTYQSPPVLEKIRCKYFDVSHKSLLIMNGFDAQIKSAYEKPLEKNKILTIGYFGAIHDHKNSFRNPEALFRSLLRFKKDVKLIFYGHAKINDFWQKELEGVLEIRGSVSHFEAIMFMRKMDLLLVLHSQKEGADEVVPAKLFEYMLAQRPILVIGPSNMEAAKIVKKEGIGYTADISNKDGLNEVLTEIYALWKENQLLTYSIDQLRYYSRQIQFSKLLELLQ